MTTKKQDLLDRIDVREPCTESWEEMTGNDKVRFCSHCAKNVYDISAYTRERAEKLVRDSAGGLCVRYRKDDSGRVVTAAPRFTQIKRRAKIAAGVLATTLSVASMAYSQGGVGLPLDKGKVEKKDKSKEPTSAGLFVISGTVTDSAGAVVPGAEITLKYTLTNRQFSTRSNGAGEFEFRHVTDDALEIEVNSPGFKKSVVNGLRVTANVRVDVKLEVGESTVGLLIVTDEPIACDEPPVIGTVISAERIESLPMNPSKNLPIMGLFPGVAEKPETKKPAKKTKKKLPK